ncbi:MAG TPA: hypothetical protein VIU61_16455, partial [Kofleriaceae bacterium]
MCLAATVATAAATIGGRTLATSASFATSAAWFTRWACLLRFAASALFAAAAMWFAARLLRFAAAIAPAPPAPLAFAARVRILAMMDRVGTAGLRRRMHVGRTAIT